MGNVNGREDDDGDGDGDGNGSSTVDEDGQEQDDMAASGDAVNIHHDDPGYGGGGEFISQSPPTSPRASQSPLLFRPQMPLPPLQSNEMPSPSPPWMQTSSGYEEMYLEQCIPAMFIWSYGGSEVAVEGSWDNWKSRTILERSGKDLTIVKVLPSGFFQYRFIVDGQCRHAPDMPWNQDEEGNFYNTLDLKEYVPDDIESIAGFEPPQSPDSSYNNSQFGTEDFAKEPPIVPQHLQMTLLNVPSSDMEIPVSLSRPRHVVLNHLYMQKSRSSPSVVALGSTHRFMSKYVTVVLHKSLQR